MNRSDLPLLSIVHDHGGWTALLLCAFVLTGVSQAQQTRVLNGPLPPDNDRSGGVGAIELNPTGTHIAYKAQTSSSNFDLFLASLDGSLGQTLVAAGIELEALSTSFLEVAREFEFTPDGGRLVYVTRSDAQFTLRSVTVDAPHSFATIASWPTSPLANQERDLYLTPDGSTALVLTGGSGGRALHSATVDFPFGGLLDHGSGFQGEPVFSSDSGHAFLQRGTQLVRIDLASGVQVELVPPGGPAAAGFLPLALTSDDARLVADSDSGLISLPSDGSGPVVLLEATAEDYVLGDDRIAYMVPDTLMNRWSIRARAVDGSDAPTVISNWVYLRDLFELAPDGDTILYRSTAQLFRTSLSSGPTLGTSYSLPFDIRFGGFSADGARVLFAGERLGVMDLSGAGRVDHAVPGGATSAAGFSSDGSRYFALGNQNAILSVAVEDGSVLSTQADGPSPGETLTVLFGAERVASRIRNVGQDRLFSYPLTQDPVPDEISQDLIPPYPGARVEGFTVTPDGDQAVYWLHNRSELWHVDVESGAGPALLTERFYSSEVRPASFSPSGSHLWWFGLDDGLTRRDTLTGSRLTYPGVPFSGFGWTFLPDDVSLMWTNSSDLYLIGPTGELEVFPAAPEFFSSFREPTASPDGAWIHTITSGEVLSVVSRFGGGPPVPITNPLQPVESISPVLYGAASTYTAFLHDTSGNQRLKQIPTDGSAFPIILNGPLQAGSDVEAMSLLSDGQTLVYLADEIDGEYRTYSVPIDASRARIVTSQSLPTADTSFREFTTSHDGAWAFVTAPRTGPRRLYAVPQDPGQPAILVASDFSMKAPSLFVEGRAIYRSSQGLHALPLDDVTNPTTISPPGQLFDFSDQEPIKHPRTGHIFYRWKDSVERRRVSSVTPTGARHMTHGLRHAPSTPYVFDGEGRRMFYLSGDRQPFGFAELVVTYLPLPEKQAPRPVPFGAGLTVDPAD